MKKSLLISSVLVLAALTSQSALADVRVRAGISSATYNLGGDYITAKSNYTPVNLGLTFSGDSGMYVDLAGSSGTGKHDGWTSLGFPAENFKRTDAALTLGSSHVSDGGIGSVFYVGYKIGTTTLGAENAGLAWTEETFKSSGLILGGGASLPIAGGSAGSVGVNLGLGLMSATWQDTTGFNQKSKTKLGFSLGANYNFPISSHFGVIADLKYNSYSYKFDNPGFTPNPFTVNEKISSLGATLYAKF